MSIEKNQTIMTLKIYFTNFLVYNLIYLLKLVQKTFSMIGFRGSDKDGIAIDNPTNDLTVT